MKGMFSLAPVLYTLKFNPLSCFLLMADLNGTKLTGKLIVKTFSFKSPDRNPKIAHLMPTKKQKKYVSEETTYLQMRKLPTN